METKERVPLFYKLEKLPFTIPAGEQWYVKQMLVKLKYLDEVDDHITIMVCGKMYSWYIATGENKIECFRKDTLFIKCALILDSLQIVKVDHKNNYEVWFEGERTRVL